MHLSISNILTKSIDLCKNNIKLFSTYILWMFIPTLVLSVSGTFLPSLIPDSSSLGVMGVSFFIYILLAIALSAISFWFSLAFIRVVAKRYAGESVLSFGEELKSAKSVFWFTIGVSVLTGLAVFGGMLLLIIPGIIFAVWFAFSMYAIVLDGKRPIEAMKYSKSLVDGRWWGVFVRLAVPNIVFAFAVWIIADIISVPFSMVLERTDITSSFYATWALLKNLVESLVTSVLLTPLSAAVMIILFQHLKTTPKTAPVSTPPTPSSSIDV